ncbi:O-methyltransferase [Pseudomonas viridiflava]|uniref:O-methyltransferase n=1 Tax=Pseudomonas viridiflava TaxID=33069 RepID=UPI002EC3390A|nr:O-methyltransferase [Pseudomonas viridiflava]
MAASFRKIDYSLRPAKYAERKMLVDVFRRLTPFQPVEDYNYVGFGSVWFSDFVLFHKILGIKNMVSIEKSEAARARFEENRPFQIRMEFSTSSEALPKLDWTQRTIAWLDYDDTLVTSMLQDVRSVASRALSGSILAVSVQCTKAKALIEYHEENDPSKASAIERFRQTFGRERIPDEARDEDLAGWPYGALCRKMLATEIELALSDRNTAPETAMRFLPICEIEYQDDARMTTIVGVFVTPEDMLRYESCAFNKLDFIPQENKVIRIEMPKLTVRELRRIEQQLPSAEGVALSLGSIPVSDAEKFSKMYRYFPNFAVMEA